MNYLYLASGSAILGYLIFIIIFRLLPKRLKSDLARDREEIFKDAERQAEGRRKSELERLEEELQLEAEQLEAEVNERKEDAKVINDDLDARERSMQLEESRVQKVAKDLEIQQAKTNAIKSGHQMMQSEIDTIKSQLISQLEAISNVDARQVKKNIQDTLIDSRQIEYQKAMRILDEDLSTSSKRLATRLLGRALGRYEPNFYWPKSINAIEVTEREIFDQICSDGEQMLQDLRQVSECEIELLPPQNDYQLPLIKLAGGAGINREAARLAIEEILPRGLSSWSKATQQYDRFRVQLEQHAIILGQQAIKEVKLKEIHPEIQKLVGYLNWRTSYRQNQWYHTVEVAKLAGIIAAELGVDPDAAKRCGLLHDIGKALDYKIEGSHAVISGDYADRYGESRLICDTVMSHHNDLIVESPLAYVLRAADTLSGARPGARVNLEEGYQLRLSGIETCVRSFPGILSVSIMNGAREVHVEVNNKRVQEHELNSLASEIARKVEAEVAFPGEIKILVTRRFEATSVA